MTTTKTDDGKLTVDEHIEALTGFDEIAIEKQFGEDLDSLRPTMRLRALLFIRNTRAGQKAKEAHDAAMGLTLKQVGDQFALDENEPMPEEPVTEAGKDDSLPI